MLMFLQRLGGPNEDSNMSADVHVVGSPESQSNMSQKSMELPSNNNESITMESHTPPLPTEKLDSPPPLKKRKSRFEDAPPNESDKKTIDRCKQEEKQTKKSNEWDMFAEADNIGDFNVRLPFFSPFVFLFLSLYF